MPVDIKDLPVKLPEDVDFRPTGLSPLTRSKKFQAGIEKKYGRGAHRETDTMDTFVDSSWYFLRYADPDNQKEFAGQEALTSWLPVDLYIGGAEHATGHLIFARFLTKVLHKLGYLNFNEPFLKLRHQGLIMGTDGFKMSKSRGNVINPDSLIEKFGADSFRLYEMFIGPFSQNVAWNVRGIEGVHRFLGRIFAASQKVAGQSSKEAESALHNLIKKITHDIENFKFNTAVSGLMEFFNGFGEKMSKAEWQRFLVLLYPFAPHLACELWSRFKIKGELWNAAWPGFDERLTQSKLIKLPVQINGKLKGLIEVAPNASEGEVLELIKKDKRLAPLIVKIKKVIYRAGRIVNLVS
jgi:leucyl-tRNA synthetase